MAEPVGALRAELSLGWASFEEGFKSAAGSVNNFGKTFKGLEKDLNASSRAIGSIVTPIAGAMAAVGGAIAFATYKLIDQSSALVTLSDQSGHTIEWLEKTGFAASTVGLTIEDVVSATGKLQRSIGEGSEQTVSSIDKLGLSFADLRNSSPDEQMQKVLIALGKIQDPADRTTLAVGLLGKSGDKLIPLTGNMEALQRRAEELGLVMGDKSRRNAEALGGAVGSLQSAFGGLSNRLASVVTDNASVHALVNGLATVFGNLSTEVSKNKDGLLGWVNQGAILAADGLITLSKAAGIASTAWDALQLVWRGAYHVGLELSLLLQKGFVGWGKGTEAQMAARAETERMIKAIEAEIAMNSEGANKAVEAGQKRQAAIELLRAELEKLKLAVEGAAGKDLELAGGAPKTAEQLQLESEAARKLAEWFLKVADATVAAAKAEHDRYMEVTGKEEELQARLTDSTKTGTDARIAELARQQDAEIRGLEKYRTEFPQAYASMVAMVNMYYQQMTAAAQGHYANAGLAAASLGVQTQAELETTATNAEGAYQMMLASGQFTYGGLVAAGTAAAAAQQAASGGTALTQIQQLQQMATVAAEAYTAISQKAGATDAEITAAHKAATDAQKKVDAAAMKIRLDQFQAIASAASGMLRSLFGKNKSAAIAAAIIDTAAAVVSSFRNGGGWPWGLVPAAAMAAAGYAQIQQIRSQDAGFAAGTPGTSFVDFGRGTSTTLHDEEAVVNMSQGKSLGSMLSGMVKSALRGPSIPSLPVGGMSAFDPAVFRELQGLRAEQRAFRSSLPIALRDAVMLARA